MNGFRYSPKPIFIAQKNNVKMNNPRPLNHLNAASKLYPAAWKQIDELRRDRGVDLPDWPAWCFLPLAGWYAIVSADAGVSRLPVHLIPDVARLAAIGTWRYSQGIYRFDAEAAGALADTVTHGDMPVEVLMRLPEWCVYIETPGRQWLNEPLHGFWAHLEWDANTHRSELRLLLDCGEMLMPQILHLGPWTVTEAVDRWFSEAKRQSVLQKLTMPDETIMTQGVETLGAAINPLLSMLLYLCSDEPDIGNRDYPEEKPGRPQPKKTKKGWRLFPPKKPRIWQVGETIGAALRRDLAEPGPDTVRTVRPHLRRAHWHGYWTGPKTGERRFRYKWLPPIVVTGGNDGDD